MKKIWKNLIHPPKILLFIVYFITICLVILSILLLNIDFSDLISNISICFYSNCFWLFNLYINSFFKTNKTSDYSVFK